MPAPELRAGGCVAAHPAELAVGGDGQDRLDREVGVVSQMAHEVVGAELVLGVSAVIARDRLPSESTAATRASANEALPSILAIAAQSKIRLPLSSTGIMSASFVDDSPPP